MGGLIPNKFDVVRLNRILMLHKTKTFKRDIVIVLRMYDLQTLILVTLYIQILPDKTHTIKISEIIKTRPGATFAINNRMFLGLQGISKKVLKMIDAQHAHDDN